jgi:hypothetical protein
VRRLGSRESVVYSNDDLLFEAEEPCLSTFGN